MSPITLADHIFFGLLAFVLPLLLLWRNNPGQMVIPQNSRLKNRIYWMNSAVLWVGAIIVAALWFFGGHSFQALGFRLPVASAFPHWMLLTIGFVLLYFMDAMFSWNSDDENSAAAILPANWHEFAHFGSIVSFSAAFCEEIVFRGFLVTYLLTLTEGESYSTLIAVFGSAFVFGIVHIYQGWSALFKIMLLSILFAWLFILTRSLLLLILLHFVVDFSSGILAVVRTRYEKTLLNQYR